MLVREGGGDSDCCVFVGDGWVIPMMVLSVVLKSGCSWGMLSAKITTSSWGGDGVTKQSVFWRRWLGVIQGEVIHQPRSMGVDGCLF